MARPVTGLGELAPWPDRGLGGVQGRGAAVLAWPSCYLASCSSGDRNFQVLHGPRGQRAPGSRAVLPPTPEAPPSRSPIASHLSVAGACSQPGPHGLCLQPWGPHADAESLDLHYAAGGLPGGGSLTGWADTQRRGQGANPAPWKALLSSGDGDGYRNQLCPVRADAS